jgi:hypothetical protein
VALLGGAVAPALFLLGLKRINPAAGSSLLVLEAPLTILVARLALKEHIGSRVGVAATPRSVAACSSPRPFKPAVNLSTLMQSSVPAVARALSANPVDDRSSGSLRQRPACRYL